LGFAVETSTIYWGVHHTPTRPAALRRLANIAADPAVCVLADHYDEDWTQLWWARADGIARVIGPEDPAFGTAVGLLAGRYRQYQEDPPPGPVIAIRVRRWSGWAAWPAAHS
jgi:PPOX class probable F420-dependent enzyme